MSSSFGINLCAQSGWLVGPDLSYPTDDPAAWQWPGREPVQACSRLFCARCHTWVQEDPDALSASGSLSVEDRSSAVRVYRCGCAAAAIPFAVSTDRMRLEGAELTLPRVHWFCAGHVAAHLPVEIEGLVVGDSESLGRALREVVSRPTAARDSALSAMYFRLLSGPLHPQVADWLVNALRSPDILMRSAGLSFWRRHAEVGDGGVLLQAWRDADDLYRGVADPADPRLTLEDALFRGISRRAQRQGLTESKARDELRAFALRSAASEHVLPTLVSHDLAWVLIHAGSLAASSPTASRKLSMALRRAGVAPDRVATLIGVTSGRSN